MEASTEAERRKIIGVRHLCPTVQTGSLFIPASIGDPLDVQLARLSKEVHTSQLKGWWKDYVVHFVGVESSIIAGERYKSYQKNSSFVSDPSVVIFAGALINMSAVYADMVWCPDIVPSFVMTGRVHEGYYEQRRKRTIHKAPVIIDSPPPLSPLVVPTTDWRCVNHDFSRPKVLSCSCRVELLGGEYSFDCCPDHFLVRAVKVNVAPARKKVRIKGIYKMAIGWFSYDGLQWYRLEGAPEEYAEALFRDTVVWNV